MTNLCTLSQAPLWESIQAYALAHPPRVTRLGVKHYFQLMLSYLHDVYEELDPTAPIDVVLPLPTSLFEHEFLAFWKKLPETYPLRKFDLRLVPTVKASKNPVIVICHSYLSTLPQEIYRFQDGKAYAGLVQTEGEVPSLTCRYTYSPTPLAELPHSTLANYRHYGNHPLFFPQVALEKIAAWDEVTNGRLLLLVGDSGPASEMQTRELGQRLGLTVGPPPLALNFHILALWAGQQGGTALIAKNPDPRSLLAAFLFAGSSIRYPRLSQTYREIADFTTQDYSTFIHHIDRYWPSPNYTSLSVLVKIALLDPSAWAILSPKIRKLLALMGKEEKRSLYHLLIASKNELSPTIQTQGPAYQNLGELLFQLNAFKEASDCYETARLLSGDSFAIYQALGLCYAGLKDTEASQMCFNKAQEYAQ